MASDADKKLKELKAIVKVAELFVETYGNLKFRPTNKGLEVKIVAPKSKLKGK